MVNLFLSNSLPVCMTQALQYSSFTHHPLVNLPLPSPRFYFTITHVLSTHTHTDTHLEPIYDRIYLVFAFLSMSCFVKYTVLSFILFPKIDHHFILLWLKKFHCEYTLLFYIHLLNPHEYTLLFYILFIESWWDGGHQGNVAYGDNHVELTLTQWDWRGNYGSCISLYQPISI